jgi:hypothetical protein
MKITLRMFDGFFEVLVGCTLVVLLVVMAGVLG